MPTILVTGGAGFIGSCFVRMAIENTDDNVVTLDKLTYAGSMESLADVAENPRHRFVKGDIADGELILRLLEEHQPTAIVNFAAESHVDRSIYEPANFVQTNVLGAFQLLEVSRHYWSKLPKKRQDEFRFIQVSSDEVYGSLGPEGLFSEDSPFAPNSPYSASKASAGHFARAYWKTYGLPVLVTNSSNNYGPYQSPEKLIPLMILAAVSGDELPVYGDGLNVRDWLFVEDNCRAIRAVLDAGLPGRVYNIGSNCQRTNLDVVKAICSIIDRLCPDSPRIPSESLIRFVADRPGHDRRYALDTSRIRNELDWQPAEEFESGLEQTVRWYLENKSWVQDAKSRLIQIDKEHKS